MKENDIKHLANQVAELTDQELKLFLCQLSKKSFNDDNNRMIRSFKEVLETNEFDYNGDIVNAYKLIPDYTEFEVSFLSSEGYQPPNIVFSSEYKLLAFLSGEVVDRERYNTEYPIANIIKRSNYHLLY